jgi:hypothetical protein
MLPGKLKGVFQNYSFSKLEKLKNVFSTKKFKNAIKLVDKKFSQIIIQLMVPGVLTKL